MRNLGMNENLSVNLPNVPRVSPLLRVSQFGYSFRLIY